MMAEVVINWTPEKAKAFKKRYNQAVKDNEETFSITIDDVECEFVTLYAKYLLEYLTNVFGKI